MREWAETSEERTSVSRSSESCVGGKVEMTNPKNKKKGSVSEYHLSMTLWSPVTTGNLTSCRHLSHLFYRKKKKQGQIHKDSEH